MGAMVLGKSKGKVKVRCEHHCHGYFVVMATLFPTNYMNSFLDESIDGGGVLGSGCTNKNRCWLVR
jgi:hypothetical protein